MTDEAYDAQIIVRLPASLKEWVQSQAKANRRSVNGQVVIWLEDLQTAFERPPVVSAADEAPSTSEVLSQRT